MGPLASNIGWIVCYVLVKSHSLIFSYIVMGHGSFSKFEIADGHLSNEQLWFSYAEPISDTITMTS